MIVNGFTSKAAAVRHLKENGYNIGRLLSAPTDNPKLAKNEKVGVLSAPLHLAPASLSGFNVCPMASKGCIKACLHTAGNPAYMEQKNKGRIEKTRAYIDRTTRAAFMAVLAFEIRALQCKASDLDKKTAVRLNATSDVFWERVRVDVDGVSRSLMDHFPSVVFYDYTKVAKRAVASVEQSDWPSNYHLTFSRSENNHFHCNTVLRRGGTVAVVFDKVPTSFEGFPVIDGDEHDYRPADGHGVIIGLKAKGDAKKDTTGFVVRG